jgi:hypothetical protein
MHFCFYPQHEHGCPHVSHCPHLGGAALGTLVEIANTSGDTIDGLHKAVDLERKRNTELVEENLRLEKALEQAKLELKLERQNKFATNQQKEEDNATDDAKTPDESSAANQPKKRGAPVGHPGWFRPTPTHYDWSVDVCCAAERCGCVT